MRFKRAVQRYGRTPGPETPYQRAGQLWDERIGSARVQARNWRLMAFGGLFLTTGLSAGLIWQSMQSRVVPYVVEVDALGEARAVAPVATDYRPTDPQIVWHLGQFIMNIRAKSLDPVLMRENWLSAYDFVSPRGAIFEERVLTLADAVAWLTSLQDPVDDGLAEVDDKPAYAIDQNDGIFDGLPDDYPAFERWWRKCCEEHRPCWLVRGEGGRIDGLVVRKDEGGAEIGLPAQERMLKLCTFKVARHAQGHKVGELLLRKALWHAQLNGYDAVYLTTFPRQRMLLDLLARYGFVSSARPGEDELNVVKRLSRNRLEVPVGGDLAEAARLAYPRFSLDEPRELFAIPVQWQFHRQLFPEAALLPPLPLFAERTLFRTRRAAAGNTIRKVYVCRASTKRMKGGDVVFFYQSKDDSADNSQSITTVGVIEQVGVARDGRELSRLTAGRSVFSEADLQELCRTSPRGVTVIDFLHVQHLQPPVELSRLLQTGVLRGPPQSITGLPRASLAELRPSMNFGFAL